MDGWMICDFTSFSTLFQSYQDDGRIIIKGCVQWNPVYDYGRIKSIHVHVTVRLASEIATDGQAPRLLNLFHAQLMKFSFLINVKIPTNVGIFIFICIENFTIS